MEIKYSLLSSEKDIKKAFKLVAQEYSKQGYLKKGQGIDVLPCFLIGGSAIFSAEYGSKIIGTVSVITDSNYGLPMDEIYRKELDILRKNNKKIAEIGRLATDSDFLKTGFLSKKYNNLSVLFSLFKLAFHFSLYKGFDNLCISINPKHNFFYKSLGFKDIGGLKYYPLVNNAPALAKTLDLNKIKKQSRVKSPVLNLFYNNPPDYKIFKKN